MRGWRAFKAMRPGSSCSCRPLQSPLFDILKLHHPARSFLRLFLANSFWPTHSGQLLLTSPSVSFSLSHSPNQATNCGPSIRFDDSCDMQSTLLHGSCTLSYLTMQRSCFLKSSRVSFGGVILHVWSPGFISHPLLRDKNRLRCVDGAEADEDKADSTDESDVADTDERGIKFDGPDTVSRALDRALAVLSQRAVQEYRSIRGVALNHSG
ncbi:hypothetical protein KC349_g212 [Hortaea werneckii]|nr:hypothetical protein KC349_g212 [Hortaea werneckii]